MATEVQNHTEPSVTSLVSGIVSDFQDLIKQQLLLTRKEIEADLRKSKEAVSILAVGWTICLIGVFAVCLMLALLLHWLGAPAGTDPSSLPLWASFAVVGCLFLIGGVASIVAGKKKIDAIGLEDTAQALKENIEWKTKTSPS